MADSEKNINELLSNNKIVIINFWANWSAPCRSLKPIVDEIDNEYSELKVVNIDVDNYKDLNDYSINVVPTIIFFKDAKEVDRIRGCPRKSGIVKIIEGITNTIDKLKKDVL